MFLLVAVVAVEPLQNLISIVRAVDVAQGGINAESQRFVGPPGSDRVLVEPDPIDNHVVPDENIEHELEWQAKPAAHVFEDVAYDQLSIFGRSRDRQRQRLVAAFGISGLLLWDG